MEERHGGMTEYSKKFKMRFTEMKKQYVLFLFLEAWAISSHIFHEITPWVLASENTTWYFPNNLVLFKIIQHCFHSIKPVLTAYSLENILLFHFQKNSVINSYCFLVVIAFLRQPSNLTCRHVFNFSAIERPRPSPPPHHISLKSWGRVSPLFLQYSALVKTNEWSLFVWFLFCNIIYSQRLILTENINYLVKDVVRVNTKP